MQNMKSEPNELFNQFFLHSIDLLCIADTSGIFKNLNPEWEKILGYSISDLVGKRFIELVHPDDLEETRINTQLAKTHPIPSFTNRFRHKNGSYRWIEWKSFPAKGLIFASARDITEHKKAEDEVKVSEQKFRSIFENSTVGIALVGLKGEYIMVNQAFCSMLGYSSDELTKLNLFVLTHPDDIDKSSKNMQDVIIGTGKELSFTKRYIHKNGNTIWTEVSSRLLLDNVNKPMYFITHIKDVTKRVQAENEFKTLASLNNAILETVTVGLAYTVGRIIQWSNDLFCKLFGYENFEIIGHDTNKLYKDKELYQNIGEAAYAALSKGETYSTEALAKKKDGQLFWVYLSATALDSSRPLEGSIWMVQDITPQKEMEKKLFEAILQTEEKEKQGFAQDLHDELGPFLSGIKLYIDEIELASRNKNHQKELVEYLRKMVDEAIIKTRIISNSMMSNILMDFGLGKALTAFVDKMNYIHGVEIKLDLGGMNGGLSKTMEITIYRVVIELINNSLKHANPRTIMVILNQRPDSLNAVYKDDGKGFNIEEELKSPSGIGLTSIFNRLKSCHAHYKFSSRPNGGMTFEFNFPLN